MTWDIELHWEPATSCSFGLSHELLGIPVQINADQDVDNVICRTAHGVTKKNM